MALQQMANNKGCSPSQLAIAWVLHQGDDILPLAGTTNRKHLSENLKALDITLDEKEIVYLNVSYPEGFFSGSRYDEQQMKIVVS